MENRMSLQKEVTQFEIIKCPGCDKGFITTKDTDNAYNCDVCRVKLTHEIPMVYQVPDSELIKFIGKHYKGKPGESYS